MNKGIPKPDKIEQLLDGVYPALALLAGMELDLFTHLEETPQDVERIADEINVRPSKLKPLLFSLVAAGLLTIEAGQFSNKPVASQYLVQGKPTYLGDVRQLLSYNWQKVLRTAETIRAGRKITDVPSLSNQDSVATVLRGLYPGTIRDAQRLMRKFDFSAYNSLLDIGGGSGGLAISMVEANPGLKATVFDLPSATPLTKQFVEAANAGEQVDIISGDAIHDTLPGEFDVVVARHFVQVFSEDDARTLLKNIARSVKPGGVLFIIGWILDNSRLKPERAVNINLVLLNDCDEGQAYTEKEYISWLAEAGFVDYDRIVMPDQVSILTARKPGQLKNRLRS